MEGLGGLGETAGVLGDRREKLGSKGRKMGGNTNEVRVGDVRDSGQGGLHRSRWEPLPRVDFGAEPTPLSLLTQVGGGSTHRRRS